MFSKIAKNILNSGRRGLSVLTTKNRRSITSRPISTAQVYLSNNQNKNDKTPPSFSFNIQTPNSSNNNTNSQELEARNLYEKRANETLESLTEKFDSLVDQFSDQLSDDFDVAFSNGVLTVKLGKNYGTYVMNKQTPNLQIWLSSPLSGPKRYDFLNGTWIYKRTGESLHELLTKEISEAFKSRIDFTDCLFGTKS